MGVSWFWSAWESTFFFSYKKTILTLAIDLAGLTLTDAIESGTAATVGVDGPSINGGLLCAIIWNRPPSP